MLTRIFIKTSVAVVLTAAAIAVTTFFINYNLAVKDRNHKAQKNADKIYSAILENFDHTEKLLSFMGGEILKRDKLSDLDFIHKLFIMVAQTENKNDSLFSWSKFDWVDKSNKQVVNTMTGITKQNPRDMSERDYTRDARLDPWKLKFVRPLIGYPSRSYVIPIGVGVFSKEKGYAGLIAVGVDIKKLIAKITSAISEENEFMLIGADGYDFFLGSSFNFLKNEASAQELLGKIRSSSIANEKGFLSKEVNFNDMRYIYSLPMGKDYPYIIITGYDQKKFWYNFYLRFIPTLIQIISTAIFIEIILVALWMRSKSQKQIRQNSARSYKRARRSDVVE